MSDDNPTPEASDSDGGTWKAPATQEELNSIVEKRLARERAKYADYDEIAKKAAEFDKTQEASKTEIQKATERAEKAEKALADATSSSLRSEVALSKGLTPTQAKRLVGNTREELEADADELLSDLGDQKPGGPRAPQQKTRQTSTKEDPKANFANRLFGASD